MGYVKKGLLLVVAVFTAVACLFGVVCCIEVGQNMDLQEGKVVIFVLYFLMTVGFGLVAFICFKLAFQKEKVQQVQKEVIASVGDMVQEPAETIRDNVVH